MPTPTPAEVACFEAGIKFGSLYHQFAGTPISPESAPSLARAIEAAIENQPHCTGVSVDVDTDALARAIEDGTAGYAELTGRFLDVELAVEYENVRVVAGMELVDDYPRMAVRHVETTEP